VRKAKAERDRLAEELARVYPPTDLLTRLEVRLPEYDHVAETFPSDRADQSLHIRILPRRARGNGLVADAHGS